MLSTATLVWASQRRSNWMKEPCCIRRSFLRAQRHYKNLPRCSPSIQLIYFSAKLMEILPLSNKGLTALALQHVLESSALRNLLRMRFASIIQPSITSWKETCHPESTVAHFRLSLWSSNLILLLHVWRSGFCFARACAWASADRCGSTRLRKNAAPDNRQRIREAGANVSGAPKWIKAWTMDAEITLCEALISCKQGWGGGVGSFHSCN